ncbi:MAG: GDSL-type esterase/lipase family protein, partial [Candidatus Methanoperedens sp.]|nr:GDSL-type esterase/lipase family protein [Candidatus Methanoperedens sp.]
MNNRNLLLFIIVISFLLIPFGNATENFSKTAPYSDIPDQGGANWGSTDREFLQAGHNDRIRQNGTIYQIRFAVANVSRLTQFNFTIWRQNGSNYDRIATTNNLLNNLSNGINVINLSPPIEAQEGDFYGYRVISSEDALYANDDMNHFMYYKEGGVTSFTNYNWTMDVRAAKIFVIEIFMKKPYMVLIGDSIISGYPEHRSFIEPYDFTNISVSIQNQWARKVNRSYQNMGYSGDDTTEINARFYSDAVNLSPEFVLIEGGTNDVSHGDSSEIILANWNSTIQKAFYNNITPVIMLILPDSRIPFNTDRMVRINEINEQLKIMSMNYSPSIIVDARCYIGVNRSSGPPGNCWTIDANYTPEGLHFNSAGNERIAQAIKDSFRYVYGKQQLYNLIQSDGTIIYSMNLRNAINTSWRIASTMGITNVSYNVPSPVELANLTVNSGTVDWFNIDNVSSNQVCQLRYSNDSLIESKIVLNGNVNFTADLSPDTYYVQCIRPSITSWGNNRTNNASLIITANTSEMINFNATANQTIDTWQWFKDDVSQNNNYNNLTVNFSSTGIHTIRVNASNTNGTSNTITWTVFVKEPNKYIVGNGGSTWQGNATFDNTTQDNGDHYVKVGRWADNFEDNNEYWSILTGKNALSILSSPAIGAYSFGFVGNSKAENYNYVSNITSSSTPVTLSWKVYDNGVGNANIWFVQESTGTQEFIGVDSTGGNICPSGQGSTTTYCYRIGYARYSTSVPRLTDPGWVEIRIEFNGTHSKGYVNNTLIYTTARTTVGEMLIGNAWSYNGVAYFDEVRVYQQNQGNLTIWYNAGTGNETYKIDINANTPENTNYTVWYRQNNTGSFVQLGGIITGNTSQTISGEKYQNTDVQVRLAGNTATPKLNSITFYTRQGSSGNNPPSIISWGNNKTDNNSLTLTANTSESVKFNATANQTIDTWQWFKDDVSQNNNY